MAYQDNFIQQHSKECFGIRTNDLFLLLRFADSIIQNLIASPCGPQLLLTRLIRSGVVPLCMYVGCRVTRCDCEKVAQNVAQSIFCWKLIHNFCCWKSSPIICETYLIITKLPKVPPNRRKIAQSRLPGMLQKSFVYFFSSHLRFSKFQP
jgi:hypothetical protein